MATGLNQHSTAGPPSRKPFYSDEQLRKDRTTAIVMTLILLVVVSLIIWLASISGGTVHEGIETWPMMPW